MIKSINAQEFQKAKISVFMKSGEDYLGCDVPPDPFERRDIVAFWVDDVLNMVPLADVRNVAMYFED